MATFPMLAMTQCGIMDMPWMAEMPWILFASVTADHAMRHILQVTGC